MIPSTWACGPAEDKEEEYEVKEFDEEEMEGTRVCGECVVWRQRMRVCIYIYLYI